MSITHKLNTGNLNIHFSTHEKPQTEKQKSNTIGLLIEAAPVLFKKLPQSILNIIHIPCIKGVINLNTCTYNIDTRALTVNMFQLSYTSPRFRTYLPPSCAVDARWSVICEDAGNWKSSLRPLIRGLSLLVRNITPILYQLCTTHRFWELDPWTWHRYTRTNTTE
jgi:hypothetical protein